MAFNWFILIFITLLVGCPSTQDRCSVRAPYSYRYCELPKDHMVHEDEHWTWRLGEQERVPNMSWKKR